MKKIMKLSIEEKLMYEVMMAIYELDSMSFLGASPSQIIADKISVISTNKVFRRIKDIVDLYYLSRVFVINKSDVVKALNDMNKSIDDFDGFLNHKEELKHSYDKFRLIGNISKPSFDNVHMAAKEFIHDFLPNV